MPSSHKTVLVTGATGKQGGAVIDHLLTATASSSFNIVAVTRNISSPRASKLASLPNVSVIAGDLSDPEAIFDQVGPVYAVYSVQINSDAEEQQGKALIDAAILNGVQHFVYSSGDRGGPERSPKNPTTVKNFAAKHAIEKHLEQRALKSHQHMTYTILRPVSFFDNLSADIHGRGFARMWEQLGDKKLQLVSTKDIGWFAAQSIRYPDKYHNSAVTLVGDELTQPEADCIFRDVTGNSMAMAPCPIANAVKFVLKGTVGDMFKWFAEEGYGGSVEACRAAYPEMQDFRGWIKENINRFS